MNESCSIESSEDHVHFPIDCSEKRWDSKGQDAIPGPIGGGGEGHSHGPHLVRENLSRHSPGDGAPGDSKGSDEKIRASNNSVRSTPIVGHSPGYGRFWVFYRVTKGSLDGAGD